VAAVFKPVVGARAPFRAAALGLFVAEAVVALTSATPPSAARST
jgi:hypothetical protein